MQSKISPGTIIAKGPGLSNLPGLLDARDADPGHERLPAEEDDSPGDDGPSPAVGERQPAALRAPEQRSAPLLLLIPDDDRSESGAPGRRRDRPHLEQPLQRQGLRPDVQGQPGQQLDGDSYIFSHHT